jgi:hypothetical protein
LIRLAAALCVATLAAASGCAGRAQPADAGDRGARQEFGVYRASFVPGTEHDERRFRLLLFAALPDRLHAEILPPVGAASLIVDAGEGRLSVLSSRDRIAYVGDASREALRKAIGVDTTVEALVRALVAGEAPGGGVEVEREPEGGTGLPRRFTIRSRDLSLSLTLEGVRKVKGGGPLGVGAPPEGTPTAPLDELPDLGDETAR